MLRCLGEDLLTDNYYYYSLCIDGSRVVAAGRDYYLQESRIAGMYAVNRLSAGVGYDADLLMRLDAGVRYSDAVEPGEGYLPSYTLWEYTSLYYVYEFDDIKDIPLKPLQVEHRRLGFVDVYVFRLDGLRELESYSTNYMRSFAPYEAGLMCYLLAITMLRYMPDYMLVASYDLWNNVKDYLDVARHSGEPDMIYTRAGRVVLRFSVKDAERISSVRLPGPYSIVGDLYKYLEPIITRWRVYTAG